MRIATTSAAALDSAFLASDPTVTTHPGRTPDAGAPAGGVHHPVGIYEQCRCDPADIDYDATHFIVDGVGLTCQRALLLVVCACCCSDERRCSEEHDHRAGTGPCPTSARR